MAESIIIHFCESDPTKVVEPLNCNFDQSGENRWYHPKDSYLLIIMPYEDYESEYVEEEKEKIRSKLNGDPTVSYDFEIRRSRSDEACDLIEKFIRNELNDFCFVVDDMENLYTKDEISNLRGFLDLYRYKKTENQSVVTTPDAARPTS